MCAGAGYVGGVGELVCQPVVGHHDLGCTDVAEGLALHWLGTLLWGGLAWQGWLLLIKLLLVSLELS